MRTTWSFVTSINIEPLDARAKNEIERFASKHKARLQHHVNVETLELLGQSTSSTQTEEEQVAGSSVVFSEKHSKVRGWSADGNMFEQMQLSKING